jgi:hypothetical protein
MCGAVVYASLCALEFNSPIFISKSFVEKINLSEGESVFSSDSLDEKIAVILNFLFAL